MDKECIFCIYPKKKSFVLYSKFDNNDYYDEKNIKIVEKYLMDMDKYFLSRLIFDVYNNAGICKIIFNS